MADGFDNSDSLRALRARFRRRVAVRRGVSLVEVAVATLIMGLLMVGAMRAFRQSIHSSETTADYGRAAWLANDLMAEVLQTGYLEPQDTPQFGLELGESAGDRSAYDDVDDYDDWDSTPPEDSSGAPLANYTAYRRKVIVSHVDPNSLSTVLTDSNDQGVKRITVEVYRNGALQTQLVSLQTLGWVNMIPDPSDNSMTGGAPSATSAPIAAAGGSPLSGTGTLNVTFNSDGSNDADGDPLTYEWDFDDGGSSTSANPTHNFTAAGVYDVTLTVADGQGGVGTDQITIVVNSP